MPLPIGIKTSWIISPNRLLAVLRIQCGMTALAQEVATLAETTTAEFIVSSDHTGFRLDVFLTEHQSRWTRSQIRKFIDEGLVLVDGKSVKAGSKLEPGMAVSFEQPPAPSTELQPVEMPLDIIFEDDHLIVINKPVGLIMHPGAGNDTDTLVHGLLAHCGDQLSFLGEHERPGIVHRLDRDTSGVVICAKTDAAHVHLAAQFEKKSNFRQYVALLDGLMRPERKSVLNWLARDPVHRTKFKSWDMQSDAPANAKHAVSHFQKVATYQQRLSQVAVQLETGRTHQIRVHALHLGLPVVGDQTYHRTVQLPETFPYATRESLSKVPRQLLHARYLGVEHPVTGDKLAFEAPLPKDFSDILEELEEFKDPT